MNWNALLLLALGVVANASVFDALDEIRNNPEVQRKMRDMLQDPDALAELSELMKDPTFKAQIDAWKAKVRAGSGSGVAPMEE